MRRPLLCTALAALTLTTAAPAGADLRPPPRSFSLDGSRLVLPSPLTFKNGGAELTADSAKAIQYIADYLQDKSYVTLLRIEGHVQGGGGADAQQRLSGQRAVAVVRALVAKGVDCKRLLPVGFGNSKPIASNDSAEGRAQNSRIEAINAQLRGKAIGGLPADGGGQVAGDPCK